MRVSGMLALALALFGAGAASAQVRIVGRVIEAETEKPIAGADIYFRTPDNVYAGRAVTDGLGRFEKIIHNREGVKIRAVRLGYRQNLSPILYFDRRDFYQVEIRLDQEAVLLAPLEVIGRSGAIPSHFLDAYRDRLRTGNGYYITRADIERQHPGMVTDLLRAVPGVEVVSSGSGERPVVQTVRGAARGCLMQVYVDGMLLNRRVRTMGGSTRTDIFRIDDAVAPASVEGIEIYAGLSSIPPEFLTPDAPCGVIAIWTRRGDS